MIAINFAVALGLLSLVAATTPISIKDVHEHLKTSPPTWMSYSPSPLFANLKGKSAEKQSAGFQLQGPTGAGMANYTSGYFQFRLYDTEDTTCSGRPVWDYYIALGKCVAEGGNYNTKLGGTILDNGDNRLYFYWYAYSDGNSEGVCDEKELGSGSNYYYSTMAVPTGCAPLSSMADDDDAYYYENNPHKHYFTSQFVESMDIAGGNYYGLLSYTEPSECASEDLGEPYVASFQPKNSCNGGNVDAELTTFTCDDQGYYNYSIFDSDYEKCDEDSFWYVARQGMSNTCEISDDWVYGGYSYYYAPIPMDLTDEWDDTNHYSYFYQYRYANVSTTFRCNIPATIDDDFYGNNDKHKDDDDDNASGARAAGNVLGAVIAAVVGAVSMVILM